MKRNILPLLLVANVTVLSLAYGDVYVTNTNDCVIKKVVIRQRITCGTYYETTFYCEHYLSPGESVEFHDGWEVPGECWHTYTVSSTTEIPLVTVSVTGGSPIYTGIGVPSGPSAYVTLAIGGSGSMNDVAVGTSNSGRFQVSEISRDVANRTIFVQVTGVAATPDGVSYGDAYLAILYKNKVCAQVAVVVVEAKTSVHTAGIKWWVNTYSAGMLFSGTYRIMSLAIKDQFEVSLDPIFAGANRVDERFDNQSGSPDLALTAVRIPIVLPTGQLLSSGVIDDENGQEQSYGGVTLTSSQAAQWSAGTLTVQLPNGDTGRNLFQSRYKGTPIQRQGTMVLWVWGTQLTTSPVRQITITTGHPAECNVTN